MAEIILQQTEFSGGRFTVNVETKIDDVVFIQTHEIFKLEGKDFEKSLQKIEGIMKAFNRLGEAINEHFEQQ